MKRFCGITSLLAALLLFVLACQAPEPQTAAKKWYKGNLHTHSYWSDGDEFPERIMEWYKSRDYHFLALTDHNRLAKGEFWKTISEDSIYRDAYAAYLAQYGKDWVVSREDSGRLEVKLKTLAEYRPLFEEEGRFLIIQSEEITDHFEGAPIHLNATNVQALIEPQGGTSVVDVLQNNIDAVLAQREASGEPMFVHVNHPNFHYAISLEDMIALQGERFFEVFNGHPQVNNLGDSTHIGTEEMWDLINIAYLAQGKPLIYSLATDDSHHYHRFDRQWSNSGRGWIMVQADSLETRTLIKAIEEGSFYASTGVSLQEVSTESGSYKIAIEAEEGVNYRIQFIGCRQGKAHTEILQESTSNTARFEIREDLLFVRAKIISDKKHPNPIETIEYEMAWTQPVLGR
ncbi:MAG: histidinol-phosphatase [Bacteroidota bacterium]